MKYNKGEWSEGYAFTKLLGDGRVYAADENLNRKPDEYYPILKMIKEEINRYYVRNQQEEIIQITNLDGEVIHEVSVESFLDVAEKALYLIKDGTRTFKVPILQDFLNGLGIITLKASSQEKSDLNIEVFDFKTETSKDFSFSVKSYLGSPPTVLNASQSTNFLYEIKGISNEQLDELNSIEGNSWLKRRMGQLMEGERNNLYSVDFIETSDKNFGNNLKLIDSNFPYIVSEILIDFYSNKGVSDIDILTERLIDRNPLNISSNVKKIFYKSKVIELIKAATFGMMPSKEWDNQYDVTGGVLTVKKDGDVLCHHIFYGKDSLDEYLYKNTKLETPSSTRYNMGKFIYENGKVYFTLNLQIRMKPE